MISKYTIPMRNDDFTSSISELTRVCSQFKMDLFRSSAANGKISSYQVREFMGVVKSFLKTWETYALELQQQIKSANPDTEVNRSVIEYQDIKPFIFASYDYASILQFADGLTRGAKNGDITKEGNYEDFFRQVVRKAFKDRPADAGMMVGEVTTFSTTESSAHETALFKSTKSRNFFDNNDRLEIYKAIDKTVEFLISDILEHGSMSEYFNGSMTASACNWVIEYAKITLTAYACRIFAISKYVYPYIGQSVATVTPVKESVEDLPGFNEYTFMKDLDESVIHVPSGYPDYVTKVKEWASTFSNTAMAPTLNNYTGRYCTSDICNGVASNPVYNKLISNSLYDYFEGTKFDLNGCNTIWSYLDGNNHSYEIENIVRQIKDFINSDNIGVGATSSPLTDLVEMIKNLKPTGETIEGYEQLAMNIIIAHFIFAGSIYSLDTKIDDYLRRQVNFPNEHLRDYHGIIELRAMLAAIYKTVGVAILFRCRDIEMKVNELKKNRIHDTFDELTIKIPGTLKSDYNKDDNNAMAVPDTNRSFTEADMISIESEMDRLALYDEWVQTIPGMENDWYYSEAFNFQDIIDKIQAIIRTIGTKWTEFFTNVQFKAAQTWCQKNGDTLKNSTFSSGMGVYDYKLFGAGTGGAGAGGTGAQGIEVIDKVIDAINACNPANLKTDEDVKKYVASLYADPTLSDLYKGTYAENKPWNAEAYANTILFGNVAAQAKNITAEEIKAENRLPKWLNDVANATDVAKGITDTNNKLTNAITSLKGKIATLPKENNTANPPAATGNNNTATEQPTPTPDVSTNATTALNRTNQAINELYVPLFRIITSMILTEYKYIQQAWGLRVQPGQQTQQANQ